MTIGKQIGPEIGNTGFSYFGAIFPLFPISGPICFPIVILGPISGPIWFPILGRRPETYFLAGCLDRLSAHPLPLMHRLYGLAAWVTSSPSLSIL